ncbi:MAG: GNAT family N-acetyltransferase [Firmicutes bacterium]|jgi:ribosomal protein S18 acetylase RimI-like enzyme|nr:GNAT family N-acetyltransferase [Bacillota bacterium]
MECVLVRGVEYVIDTVDRCDIDTLVGLFNDAYSHYYVETTVTPDRLLGLVEREDISVSDSFVAYSEGLAVGVVFLGIRGDRGYICGMGVRSSYQGRGLGEALMRAALVRASQLGLASLQLEVVEQNHRARALYSKLGFRVTRTLGVWARDHPAPAMPETKACAVWVRGESPHDALLLVDTYEDSRPCWQNEVQSLGKMASRLEAKIAWSGRRKVGYILYRNTPQGLLVADFGVVPSTEREAIGEMLMYAVDCEAASGLARGAASGTARAYNFPVGGYQEQVLRARGFELTLVQQEMVLCLRPL